MTRPAAGDDEDPLEQVDHLIHHRCFHDAAELLLQYLSEHPDDVRQRLKLADLYARAGVTDKAVRAYTQAAELLAGTDPLQAMAIYNQVLRLEPAQDEISGRLWALEQAFVRQSMEPLRLLAGRMAEEAWELIGKGDLETARLRALAALALVPDHERAKTALEACMHRRP